MALRGLAATGRPAPSDEDVARIPSWRGPSKGAVSDALKRSAVHFGIGRYLYDLLDVYAVLDGEGKVSPAMLAKLGTRLEEFANEASARAALEACTQSPERIRAAAGAA